jgi:RNA polymerase sigma-70 factor, ECF subfamily
MVERRNEQSMVLNGNDRETIEACRNGDPDAFRALFEAYQDKIYSIALRYSGDPAAAMDIAQDTFLKLMSSIGTFRGESSFDTWLYRLVANRCMDQKRRGRKLIPLVADLVDAVRAAGESALQKVLRAERAERVQEVIAKLPPEQRIVIVLRYTESLAYEEIADILGCSPGTVASRISRAHKTLERRLSHLIKGVGRE